MMKNLITVLGLLFFVNHLKAQSGYALDLGGNYEYVYFEGTFPFHQQGDRTLEFWCLRRAENDASLFWTSHIGNQDHNRFNIGCSSVVFYDYREYWNSNTQDAKIHILGNSGGFPTYTWTHHAFVREGNTYKVYKNGEFVTSTTDNYPKLPSNSGWQISGRVCRTNDNSFCAFNGQVDEVRIFNYARTKSEIKETMNKKFTGREPGLIGYWDFDEGQGRIVYDKTGNGHDGVIKTFTESQIQWVNSTCPLDSKLSRPKIWAVIIGISDYPGTSSDLKYCDVDAQKVYDFLRSPAGGSVPSSQIIKLTNSNATRDNILSNCNQLFGKAKENDLIFFYFSGHGSVYNSFVAYDQSLSHTDLRTVINKSKAKKKYCVADACFAGAWDKSYKQLVKTNPNDFYAILANTGEGLALFMSAKSDETSIETSRLGHGVFTYFYLKGLSGAADSNFDDIITIHELYKYCEKNVSKWAWDNMTHSQHPELHGKFDLSMPIGIISE